MSKVLFFEPLTQQYFYSTVDDIENAKLNYNILIHRKCWASFNEFLELLKDNSPDINIPDISEYFGNHIDRLLDFNLIPDLDSKTNWIYYRIVYTTYGEPMTYNGKIIPYDGEGNIDTSELRRFREIDG